MKLCAAVFGLLVLCFSLPSQAFRLIGEDEAKFPEAAPIKNRAISRGPGIKLVSPDPELGAVKAPFGLKIAFEPHGGAKIDPSTVKVTYLKATPVDLLDRLKPGLTATGIDLAGADAPVGDHQIYVSLQDSEGRKSNTVINIKVTK